MSQPTRIKLVKRVYFLREITKHQHAVTRTDRILQRLDPKDNPKARAIAYKRSDPVISNRLVCGCVGLSGQGLRVLKCNVTVL